MNNIKKEKEKEKEKNTKQKKAKRKKNREVNTENIIRNRKKMTKAQYKKYIRKLELAGKIANGNEYLYYVDDEEPVKEARLVKI